VWRQLNDLLDAVVDHKDLSVQDGRSAQDSDVQCILELDVLLVSASI
jgi:hypothetical protein